jgi:hypothetical protein
VARLVEVHVTHRAAGDVRDEPDLGGGQVLPDSEQRNPTAGVLQVVGDVRQERAGVDLDAVVLLGGVAQGIYQEALPGHRAGERRRASGRSRSMRATAAHLAAGGERG